MIHRLASLGAFLQKFSFASAKMTVKRFYLARGTIGETLQRDLEFRKFSRR
jgi:hypothetical protein